MECQRCKKEQLLTVVARSKDQTRYYLDNVSKEKPLYEGYTLGLFGDSMGGDHVEFTVCLDCGQVQGEFPFDINAVFDADSLTDGS